MKNRSIKFITIAIITGTLFSCAQNNKQDIIEAMGTECDTTSTRFAMTIKPILEEHCSTPSCHNATTNAGGYNLEDYASIKNAVEGNRFFGSIDHAVGYSPMPKGKDKLSNCDIERIKIWARKGAQNN